MSGELRSRHTATGLLQPNSDFLPSHSLTNLKGQTISGGFMTILSQGAQFALNLGAIMVLARLLAPEDFGLVAMVTVIMGFLRVFSDAGLSTATVQRETISHEQISNLFWVNVAVGGAVTLLLAATSPLIGWFYHEPRLVQVTLVLSLCFLVTASTVQHMALLKRQMRFSLLAGIDFAAVALGVATGVGMAWLQCGYWSLVGMQISTTLSSFVFTWTVSRWRPSLPARNSGTRSLLGFGANLTASSFLWSVARGADGLLLGRFCGSAALGLYSRAAALMVRPVQQLMAPVESVFVSALARVQAQPERYRGIFVRAYEVVALASFLCTALLFPLSRPLTLVVLGPKWESAEWIVAAFAVVALYYPFGSIATWLLTSQGRGREFLLSSVVSSSVTVASFLVGIPFGPAGVAVSYAIACLLVILPAGNFIAGRHGPVGARVMWLCFFRHLPLWFVVCLVAGGVRHAASDCSPQLQLALSLPIGLLAGAGFIALYLPSRRTALDLLHTLREWRQSRGDAFEKQAQS